MRVRFGAWAAASHGGPETLRKCDAAHAQASRPLRSLSSELVGAPGTFRGEPFRQRSSPP